MSKKITAREAAELVLGKPLNEASNEEVLKFFGLIMCELTLGDAYTAWVSRTRRRKGLSKKAANLISRVLYRETLSRMKKAKKNKTRR